MSEAKENPMSWKVEVKGDRYRIYSTIVGGFMTGWMDRNETLKVIFESKLRDFKISIIKECLRFPHHWPDYHGEARHIIIDGSRSDALVAWEKKLCHKPAGEYDEDINSSYDLCVEFHDLI